MSTNKLNRIRLPFLGGLVWQWDNGDAMNGRILVSTKLTATHLRGDKVLTKRDLGSGLITINLVNTEVSDAVAGSSVVPTLARFKYMDSGTGSTAATDGDTNLQTAITATAPSRVVATLANAQSATTGNHAAIMSYTGTVTYNTSGPTYPIAVTEWILASASSGAGIMDRKVFSAINVNNADAIQFVYSLTLSSNT